MDLTALVISSAVGGAAGGFIKELSSNGVKWLLGLVTAQSPEMQALARKNLESFVVRLAQRVERLEHELPAEKTQIFTEALNHPGSALLIKTAIVDAAITDNEERHEILAELISQRLTANADDMVALAGSASCGVVNCLTSRQIKLLAILSTIKDIRLQQKLNLNDNAAAKNFIYQWWNQNIGIFIEDESFRQITPLDFEHLVAMGCIRMSIASSDLKLTISSGFLNPDPELTESELDNEIWYKLLKEKWRYLGCSTTTSVGRLIGILHRDVKLNTKTEINW